MAEKPITTETIVGPASAPDDVLRVEHIAKRFGPVTALREGAFERSGIVLATPGAWVRFQATYCSA